MDFITAQNRAQELTKQLEYHNNLYYNQDDPEISDYDYDTVSYTHLHAQYKNPAEGRKGRF